MPPMPGIAPFAPQPIDAMPQLQSMGGAMKPLMAPQRPMGFMGRIGQGINPRNLMIAGQTLRDISTGGNSLPDLLQQLDEQRAQLEQQRWQRIQQDQAIRGWKQDDEDRAFTHSEHAAADAERQQMEAIIATLPPDQQALARLNPQAYVAGIMRNRYPAPSRARSAGSTPALPDGFQWEE